MLLTAPLLLIGCDMPSGVDSSPPPEGEPARPAVTSSDESDQLSGDLAPGAARRTVASLGNPGRAGLWLETPLVQQETPGRVRVVSTGASAAVTLLPAPGQATSGSRLSLAAMQELGTAPGDLVQLDVTTGAALQ